MMGGARGWGVGGEGVGGGQEAGLRGWGEGLKVRGEHVGVGGGYWLDWIALFSGSLMREVKRRGGGEPLSSCQWSR